jgi:hypothetical protein
MDMSGDALRADAQTVVLPDSVRLFVGVLIGHHNGNHGFCCCDVGSALDLGLDQHEELKPDFWIVMASGFPGKTGVCPAQGGVFDRRVNVHSTAVFGMAKDMVSGSKRGQIGRTTCLSAFPPFVNDGIAMNGYQNNVICTTERSMLSQQSKIPKIEWKGDVKISLRLPR